MKKYDVCIIGAGASGLAAAASMSDGIKICLMEKNDIPGKKVMATGGGRCNITNAACINKALTLEFFKSLGLETYQDDEGRYFPYSNHAPDVVGILMRAVEGKDVDIITGTAANGIRQVNEKAGDGERFQIEYTARGGKKGSVAADNVLLAVGGKAAPQLGTTGDGYGMARALGHRVERVYPILTAIECGDLSDIKGVRAKCRISLYRDRALLISELGEVQFTADGISGICVFDITPYIRAEEGEAFIQALRHFSVELDLAPDFDEEEIFRRKSTFGILSEKLAQKVGIDELKRWRLPVKGVKGWKQAQCTAGGVTLDEIDMETMESRLVEGLYFSGEIINVQGPCGGYNLQNAWETGIKAASALNRRYGEERRRQYR